MAKSKPTIIKCDGCGRAMESMTMGFGVRRRLPMGWMRLNVSARMGGDPDATNVGCVEICSPACAQVALVDTYEAIQPVPVDN